MAADSRSLVRELRTLFARDCRASNDVWRRVRDSLGDVARANEIIHELRALVLSQNVDDAGLLRAIRRVSPPAPPKPAKLDDVAADVQVLLVEMEARPPAGSNIMMTSPPADGTLKYPNSSFDYVAFGRSALASAPDVGKLLAEARRVAKGGAQLGMCESDARPARVALALELARALLSADGGSAPHTYRTRDEWVKVAEAAGWKLTRFSEPSGWDNRFIASFEPISPEGAEVVDGGKPHGQRLIDAELEPLVAAAVKNNLPRGNGAVSGGSEAPFFIDPWYNPDERKAIEAAVEQKLTVADAPRIVGEPPGDQLPYRPLSAETFRCSLHSGQRKLYLSEADFLTAALQARGADAKAVVVYAGAAPGTHIPHLAGQFPGVEWHLYDPTAFGIESSARIHTYNELFTDEIAAKWAGIPETLFICDIRVHPGRRESAEAARRAFEAQVVVDMRWQEAWVKLMRPQLAMLKFRLPYGAEKTIDYLAGELKVQAFPPQESAECRLITAGGRRATYDIGAHERWFYYHNAIRREWAFYGHGVRADGLDHCCDCALELAVHGDRLRLRLGRGPTDAELGAEVEALSRALRRGLRAGAHGADPDTPMRQKRGRLIEMHKK